MFKIIFVFLVFSVEASIDIVYHLALMGNWVEIVLEQIDALERSGLGKACDSLTVTVVGSSRLRVLHKLFEETSFRNKVTIHHAGANLQLYEFPGIEMVQYKANQNPNTRILYMHNKGVTHYQKPTEKATRSWRRYMDYFNIEKWRDCINALDRADVCGVEWIIRPKGTPYFGGNMWWARADYIRTCHLGHINRFDCEDFIGTGNQPRAINFHRSGENPIIQNLFPPESYPNYYLDPSSFGPGHMDLYKFNILPEYYR